jgi:hypothetical protein
MEENWLFVWVQKMCQHALSWLIRSKFVLTFFSISLIFCFFCNSLKDKGSSCFYKPYLFLSLPSYLNNLYHALLDHFTMISSLCCRNAASSPFLLFFCAASTQPFYLCTATISIYKSRQLARTTVYSFLPRNKDNWIALQNTQLRQTTVDTVLGPAPNTSASY